MADRNINQVNKKTSIASTDQVFMSDGGTMLKKIDYNVLAKAIIEQYTGSTLGGSSQSLKTALDAISENKATNVCERLTSPDLLDTSIAPNNYYVTGATNAPEGVSNAAGYFTVMCREGFDNTIRIVTFQPYLSYQKYVNMKMYSSEWSGWVAEPSREDFDDYSDGQIGLLVGKNIDDLHSEDTCGTYWLNNGATDVHGSFPSTGGQGLLFVKRQSGNLWRQTYIPISSGYDLKCRYYSTSTNEWTSWSDSSLATRIKGTLWRSINSGTTRTEVLDLIDSYFNETGASRISGYMDATRSGYLGLPSTAHHVDVYANSANYKLMVARSADGNNVYQLAKLAGAWESNWYTMTPFTRAGISSLDDIPIGTQGYAQFDASISPLGVQAYFTYWCTGTNDRRSIIAIITSQPTSRTFINTMHNVGVWKGWTEIASQAEVNRLYLGPDDIAIPVNSNLDDYRTAGTYVINTSSQIQTMTNAPTTLCGGRLDVQYILKTNAADDDTSKRLFQIFTGNNSNFLQWVRFFNGSTWFPWIKTPNRSDFDSMTNVTISALTTDATSGYVNLMRYGKVRIMTFTDVKASTTSINLSAALDTDDRPAKFSNNVTGSVLFASDKTVARAWVRQAGTLGTTNIKSGITYNGQIVWLID